jgi:hypothetical protein
MFHGAVARAGSCASASSLPLLRPCPSPSCAHAPCHPLLHDACRLSAIIHRCPSPCSSPASANARHHARLHTLDVHARRRPCHLVVYILNLFLFFWVWNRQASGPITTSETHTYGGAVISKPAAGSAWLEVFLSFFLWFGRPKPITGLSGW